MCFRYRRDKSLSGQERAWQPASGAVEQETESSRLQNKHRRRTKWKWHQAFNLKAPHHRDVFPPASLRTVYTTSPNSSTKWEPSVHMHKTVRDMPRSNRHRSVQIGPNPVCCNTAGTWGRRKPTNKQLFMTHPMSRTVFIATEEMKVRLFQQPLSKDEINLQWS